MKRTRIGNIRECEYNKALYEYREAKGLCVYCGKRKTIIGVLVCKLCKAIRSRQYRDWRERGEVKKFDSIVDGNLITINQGAKDLKVNRSFIHWLIKRGYLKIRGKYKGNFLVKESEIRKYDRLRYQRITTLFRCNKCGYEFSPRSNNGYKLKRRRRCPSCYGSDILKAR